jgi:hypothetical protein
VEFDHHRDDIRAVKALIARQFASLTWSAGTSGDWDGFAADFFPGASLYPAARPATRQTVKAFIERMKALAGTKLDTSNNRLLVLLSP